MKHRPEPNSSLHGKVDAEMVSAELGITIERRELKRFKEIAKSAGVSAGDLIKIFIRRTISVGKFTFEMPSSKANDSTASAAKGNSHGVSIGRLTKLASPDVNMVHLHHLKKERFPMEKSKVDEQAMDSQDDLVDLVRIGINFMEQLAADELVPEASFLARIGWPKTVLTSALTNDRMFYVELGGIRAYPAFYLDTRYDMMTLQSVTRLLGSLSGRSKWIFFTMPKASLALPAKHGQKHGTGRTPLEAIEAGDIDAVQRTALGFAER